jgi:hypothetical protein
MREVEITRTRQSTNCDQSHRSTWRYTRTWKNETRNPPTRRGGTSFIPTVKGMNHLLARASLRLAIAEFEGDEDEAGVCLLELAVFAHAGIHLFGMSVWDGIAS